MVLLVLLLPLLRDVAFGDILAPVFVAVILAYLMQGVANFMRHRGSAEVCGDLESALFRRFYCCAVGLQPLVAALVYWCGTSHDQAGRKVLVTLQRNTQSLRSNR